MKINLPLSHLAILLGLSLLPCAGQARAQNTPVPTETGTDNQNNTDPPRGTRASNSPTKTRTAIRKIPPAQLPQPFLPRSTCNGAKAPNRS